MSTQNNRVAKAVRFAIAAGFATSMIAAPQVAFAADEDSAEDDNRVVVTGSRIKRTDVEGALPVTVIDREQIEFSGESNAADLLRNLSFNSFGSFRPQSGSSAQAVSEISLRGIGSQRTLVLVNGRRLPKSPMTGSASDLNLIPLGAIERIEILSDGASAVYGSDAIGGVVNVVLRKDFEGVQVMYGQQMPSIPDDGGDREEGSIVFGTTSGSTSLLGGISFNSRDIVFARDFPWVSPGASVYGNSLTTTAEWFSWTTFPGGCTQDNFYEVPNGSAFVGNNRCAFDFTAISADEASVSNKSLYVRVEHEINNDWSIYADATAAKTDSFGRYAPVPDTSDPIFGGFGPLSVDSPNNPSNPNSPFFDPAFQDAGQAQELNWWHRFAALGNRDNFVENQLQDLLVGTKGYYNELDVEFGARRTFSKTYDIGYNYLVRPIASQYLEDGTYNLQDPTSNPDEVLNAMKATISRISNYDMREVFGSVGGDMFEMNGGTAQWFLGAEYREEFYEDQYDSLSEAGAIGGSAGNSAGGDRDITSYFFEVLLPVIDNLEVSVAGRHDDYSDYGSDFSPKVSARWSVMDDLVIRGSWGEGFRAPSLDIVTQKDSFSADSVRDEATCLAQGQPANCSVQINGTRTANPNLGSEQSEQYSLGVAWAPIDWFSGTLDYYNIEIQDRINFFDAQELINREIAGDPIPAGLGVTRGALGAIQSIIQGYGNEGTLETSGVDLNLKFSFDVLDGNFTTNFQMSHVLDYTIDGGRDQVGDPGAPEQRAMLNNVFAIGDFSFAWNIDMIGDQCDSIVAGDCEGHVPTWVTHDVQANYSTPWDGRLTVGAQNVFEKEPPIGLGNIDVRDYDFNLYDGFGRIVYFRYTQSF